MSSLPFATSEISQEVKIRMGKDGLAAEKPTTVMQNFDRTVKELGDSPALYQKRPKAVSKRVLPEIPSRLHGLTHWCTGTVRCGCVVDDVDFQGVPCAGGPLCEVSLEHWIQPL